MRVNLQQQTTVQHCKTAWNLSPLSIPLMQLCTSPELSTVTMLVCVCTNVPLGYQHALSVQRSEEVHTVMIGPGLGHRDMNIKYLMPLHHTADRFSQNEDKID